MISENIARNMYSSQGIINYPTQLHLAGHFHILAKGHCNMIKNGQMLSSAFKATDLLNPYPANVENRVSS
jgi:hypothetical protein